MKKTLVLLFVLAASASAGAVFEPWTNIDESNTGTYIDTTGSKIAFVVTAGPKAGEKALKIDADLKAGGWCGVWRNLEADLSKSQALRFQAKSSPPGEVLIAIKDANNVQYTAKFDVTADWSEVTVPFTGFAKDPYYTPPDAVLGKALDMTALKGMNFAPQVVGPSVLMIGSVSGGEAGSAASAPAKTASAAATVAAAGSAPASSSGTTVVLQDFSVMDSSIGGAWKDEKGSRFEYTYQDAEKKDKPDDKMVQVKYRQVPGGWCGMWYRTGDSWDGVDCSGITALMVKIYSKKPIVLGFSLGDENKNELNILTSKTAAGQWETLVIPVTNVPAGFKLVRVFNTFMSSPGSEGVFAIDQISVIKK